MSAICALFIGIIIYYIRSMTKDINIIVTISFIIFIVTLVLTMIVIITFLYLKFMEVGGLILFIVALLNMVIYIWIAVVTIVYWNSQHFNVHAQLNLSQLFPFIG